LRWDGTLHALRATFLPVAQGRNRRRVAALARR